MLSGSTLHPAVHFLIWSKKGFSERETSDQLLALDLQGVLNYNNADVPGLFTLATCLIDYEGHRLMAQSIFPGLFSGTSASSPLPPCLLPSSPPHNSLHEVLAGSVTD